jgi:hypothetical protein
LCEKTLKNKKIAHGLPATVVQKVSSGQLVGWSQRSSSKVFSLANIAFAASLGTSADMLDFHSRRGGFVCEKWSITQFYQIFPKNQFFPIEILTKKSNFSLPLPLLFAGHCA